MLHVSIDLNVRFVQETCSEVTSLSSTSHFPCITQSAIDRGVARQVEDELRSACTSAPNLIKTIRINEALGYLDTKNLCTQALYNILNEYFKLPFKIRTFQDKRSK